MRSDRLILLLASFSFGLFFGCHPQQERPERVVQEAAYKLVGNGELKVRDDLLHRIKTGVVTSTLVQTKIRGYGQLSFAPGASYAVRIPFDGLVEDVNVEIGARVEPGVALASVRSRELAELRASLPRLSATLNSESDSLQRLEGLFKQSAVSEREVIEARSRVSALNAEIGGIRSGLKAAKASEMGDDVYEVRAQRSGQILRRNIEPGERVDGSDSEPAFIVGDASRLIVIASFPERDANLLKVGQYACVQVMALGDECFAGSVSALVDEVDSASRTVRAVCSLNASDPRLRAELSVNVDVDIEGPAVMAIDQSAVVLRHEAMIVLVKKSQDTFERRALKLGGRVGSKVLVLDGVREGEEVIVEGAVLFDGELDSLIQQSN